LSFLSENVQMTKTKKANFELNCNS